MRSLIGLLVGVFGVVTIALIWWFVSNTQTDPNAAAIMWSSATFSAVTEENKSVLPTRPDIFADAPTNTAPEMADQVASCRVAYSHDRSQEVMIVLNQFAVGTRFSVFDGNQLHLIGELNFVPDKFQVTKRDDGSILVLFVKHKLAFGEHEEDNLDKPLRIYLDDQIIYESTKVLKAGLNHSGSAWFSVEPQVGNTSKLIIGNIDSRELHVYDIGYWLTLPYDHTTPFPRFTDDEAFLSIGTMEERLFFPIDGNTPGFVVIPAGWNQTEPVAESANTFYLLGYGGAKDLKVRKVQIDSAIDLENIPDDIDLRRNSGIDFVGREVNEIWSTTIEGEEPAPSISASNDDRWLIFNGYENRVLDRSNGNIVFSFPSDANRTAVQERLSGVTSLQGDDRVGRMSAIRISGNKLFIERSVGYREKSRCERLPVGRLQSACIDQLMEDGIYRKFRDVFSIEGGTISHYPIRRDIVKEPPCIP